MFLACNFSDVSDYLRNVVPVKRFGSKKQNHSLKYLEPYLLKEIDEAKDIREQVASDFLWLVKQQREAEEL